MEPPPCVPVLSLLANTTTPSDLSSGSPKRIGCRNKKRSSMSAAEALVGIKYAVVLPGGVTTTTTATGGCALEENEDSTSKISPKNARSSLLPFEEDSDAPQKRRRTVEKLKLPQQQQLGEETQKQQEQQQGVASTQKQQSQPQPHQEKQEKQGAATTQEKPKASPCEIFVNMHMLVSEDELRKYCLFHGLSVKGSKTNLVIRVLIHREMTGKSKAGSVMSELLSLFVRNADMIMEEYGFTPRAGCFKSQVDQCFGVENTSTLEKEKEKEKEQIPHDMLIPLTPLGSQGCTNRVGSQPPPTGNQYGPITPKNQLGPLNQFGSPTPLNQFGSPILTSYNPYGPPTPLGRFGSPTQNQYGILGSSPFPPSSYFEAALGLDWTLASPRSGEPSTLMTPMIHHNSFRNLNNGPGNNVPNQVSSGQPHHNG